MKDTKISKLLPCLRKFIGKMESNRERRERERHTHGSSSYIQTLFCILIDFCRNIPDKFASPCGGCRQIISEFGNYWVILTKPDDSYKLCTVSDLLPNGFTVDDLQAGQN